MDCGGKPMDCGGKRSATPLFLGNRMNPEQPSDPGDPHPSESGVALRFPPQSKTPSNRRSGRMRLSIGWGWRAGMSSATIESPPCRASSPTPISGCASPIRVRSSARSAAAGFTAARLILPLFCNVFVHPDDLSRVMKYSLPDDKDMAALTPQGWIWTAVASVARHRFSSKTE